MLNNLTRKLCPFITLAIASFGCGKKISDPQGQPGSSRDNQEIPSAHILRLDGSENSRKLFYMPEDVNFQVPDRLMVRAGTTAGKVVEIAYDVNPYDHDDYQFKCSYVASSLPNEMSLRNCVNYNDVDFGDVSMTTFGLYKDDAIEMRFTGASSKDLVVEAIYSMDWLTSNK